MLLLILVNILRTALLSFAYRCRGGFLATGSTQLARLLFWDLPIAASASLLDPQIGWACGILAHITMIVPLNHSPFQNDTKLKSLCGMAMVGMERVAITLLPLIIFHNLIIALAIPVGALQALAYFIGRKVLIDVDSGISTKGFSFLGINFSAGSFAKGATEWGEVMTGAMFGLAFLAADLLSKV